MMKRESISPQLHPVGQYKTLWPDIVQYLALLYIFSKSDHYENAGQIADFDRLMLRYRSLEDYCTSFETMIEAFTDTKELGEVTGLMDVLHTSIRSRNYKSNLTLRMFTVLRDEVHLVHFSKIKSVLRPLARYFRESSVPNKDLEIEIIDALRVLRNPHIKRTLIMIRRDLDLMATVAAPVDPWKKDRAEIERMAVSDRLLLIKNTSDPGTLSDLLEYAKAFSDKTALAALFHRGYIEHEAPYHYLENKLVTLANFKKLPEDVLLLYVLNTVEQKGYFWNWGPKFGRQWGTVWEALVPGRPDFTLAMVRYPVPDNFYPSDLFRVAADTMPISSWSQEDIEKIWSHATDPTSLIHKLDKATRIKLFPTSSLRHLNVGRGASSEKSDNIWLFDCTRDDVEPFYKQGLLYSRSYINQVFGDSWGEMTVRALTDENGSLPFHEASQFFPKLTVADVQLLDASPLKDWLNRSVKKRHLAENYDGGMTAYLSDLWDICPSHVREWFMSFLPPSYLEPLMEAETDVEKAQALRHHLDKQYDERSKEAAEFLAKIGGSENLVRESYYAQGNLLKYLKLLQPGEAVDFYVKMRQGPSKIYSVGDIEDYLATICPPNRAATLIFWADQNSSWRTSNIVSSLLPHLTVADVPLLMDAKTSVLQAWIVRQLKGEDVLSLSSKYPWILDYLDKVSSIPSEHLQELAAKLGDSLNATSQLAFLVGQMKNAEAYRDHPNIRVRTASLVSADADHVEEIIRNQDPKIISSVGMRDDFGENASKFLNAFFDNRDKMFEVNDPRWASWDNTDLNKFDDAVPNMTDEQFASAVSLFRLRLKNNNASRHGVPFGPNSLIKIVGNTSLLDRSDLVFAIETSKYVMFDLRSLSYAELVSRYPFDTIKNGVNEIAKDGFDLSHFYSEIFNRYVTKSEWIRSLTDSQLKHLVNEVASSYRISYESRRILQDALELRETAKRETMRGNVKESLQAAYDSKNVNQYAADIQAVFDKSPIVGKSLIEDMVKKSSMSAGFKANVVGRLSSSTLTSMIKAGGDLEVSAVSYCSELEFSSRIPQFIAELISHNSLDPEYYKRNTRLKAAMVERSTPEQALELFKFYYTEQGKFGPKVREAFLEKLEDTGFKNLLIDFLLSKEFNLRKKDFTLAMVPLVIKIDNELVSAKFNGSSRFRSNKIGSVTDQWDELKSTAEKAQWLDDISDKGIMEKLLRGLVERTLSLRTPLDEEFTIGTNNAIAVAPLMDLIQKTSRTITHAELFQISVQSASEADIREWLLTNPLKVFDTFKDASKNLARTEHSVRLDAVSKEESDKVGKILIDGWEGAQRNIRPEIKAVYRVTNPNQAKWEKRSNPSSNVKTLFHGTHFFVAGLIIQNHFKVVKTAKAGRMLGDGIYFTEVGSKCAQYITTSAPSQNEGEGVILICEVDLGNMLTLNQQNDYLRSNKWQRLNYDSIFWPKKDASGYGGRDSEYAVADVSRIRVTHAIYLRRVPARYS